ncbi:DUF6901 family protein [Pleionea sediminis]|uniref:DUF6901 family protein n=1 Tax=Pleionea sediminis TaxID=2569479 RepID=UPI001185436B|nr:hypothetical protein [Pleionea sediminis]
MSYYNIIYRFQLADNDIETVGLQLDENSLVLKEGDNKNLPEWTKLRYKQCSNCPLKPTEVPHCPVAKHLSKYTQMFDKLQSFDKVKVQVKNSQRMVSQTTNAQKAMTAFIGLVMATSGCPHTAYFRPMARFHLPLSDEKETIYRVVSMYLLAQYFKDQNDQPADWSLRGLNKIYDNISTVNQGIGGRLREATKTDTSLNAIVDLDMYTRVIPDMIEESLFEIRDLFAVYLNLDKGNYDFKF